NPADWEAQPGGIARWSSRLRERQRPSASTASFSRHTQSPISRPATGPTWCRSINFPRSLSAFCGFARPWSDSSETFLPARNLGGCHFVCAAVVLGGCKQRMPKVADFHVDGPASAPCYESASPVSKRSVAQRDQPHQRTRAI